MKRAALSMLGGVAFPLCYSVAAGPLSTLVGDYRIQMLLYAPVGWPRILASYLFPPPIAKLLVDNEAASLLYIIGSDVVLLYTLVTYFALLAFSFKRVAIKGDSPPPPDVL